jgi:DNA-binding transcriptional ArsR family regulator
MQSDDLFTAIADPTRRRLLGLLVQGERSAGDLVAATAMSQPAVSKHLRILREVGFAQVRVEGSRRLYSLRPEPLAELDAWLAPFRIFWSRKLDSLERYLDDEA